VRQARVGSASTWAAGLRRGSQCSTVLRSGRMKSSALKATTRPAKIDSADVVAADASDPCGTPLTLLSKEDHRSRSAAARKRCPTASATWTAPALFRASRLRRIRRRVRPVALRTRRLCVAPQGDHLPADIRHRRQSPPRRRIAAGDPIVRTRVGRTPHPDRSECAASAGRLIMAGRARVILHGANEAYRAELQARHKTGDRRTRTGTGIGVDTNRPLRIAPEFARMVGW